MAKKTIKSDEKYTSFFEDESKVTKKEYSINGEINIDNSYINRVVRKALLAVVLLILFIIALFYNNKANTLVISYNEQSNLTYKVTLKDNEYYDEKYMISEKDYMGDLIDLVELHFSYKFNSAEKIDYNFKYNINIDLKLFDKNNRSHIVYQKADKYTNDNEVAKENTDTFLLNEVINIDYAKYIQIAESFAEDFNIDVEAELAVSLDLEMDGKYKNYSSLLAKENSASIIIPLTKTNINSMQFKVHDIDDSGMFSVKTDGQSINVLAIIFASIFALATIYILLKLMRLVRLAKRPKSLYETTLEYILKEYDDIIVEVKKTIELNQAEELIDVKTFGELKDASKRLHKPILHMNIHKEKSWFIVKTNKEIYRFVLKAVDLENQK